MVDTSMVSVNKGVTPEINVEVLIIHSKKRQQSCSVPGSYSGGHASLHPLGTQAPMVGSYPSPGFLQHTGCGLLSAQSQYVLQLPSSKNAVACWFIKHASATRKDNTVYNVL